MIETAQVNAIEEETAYSVSTAAFSAIRDKLLGLGIVIHDKSSDGKFKVFERVSQKHVVFIRDAK